MKISLPKSTSESKNAFQLCIPLDEPPKRDPNDTDKPISFVCHRKPSDKDSASYTIKVFPFEDDDCCEQFIKMQQHYEAILISQDLESNEDRAVLIRQLFKGSALTAFENEMPSRPTDKISDARFKRGLTAMSAAIFPNRAARNQKKAMKKIRKPIDMSFRVFANRMKKLNDYLPYFPPQNNVTPTALANNEFLEMLHDALPKVGYQNKMQEHDYDPTADTLRSFIEWIEN